MSGKKILILYAAIGLGHKSIAENIGFYLTAAGYEVQLKDAQETQGGFLVMWGKKVYQWMVPRLPFIWAWLYDTSWFISATLSYRTKVAAKNYKNVLSVIQQFKPDVVISTHTTASGIISYLKSQSLYSGKFGIAFSDFHLHRYWLYGNADFYLSNIKEQKEEMIELGVDQQKIFVCGIALKPKAGVDAVATKNKLGIQNDKKVVLLSSGSQGFGVNEGLILQFINKPNIKVIVVCGKNKEAFEQLSKKFAGTNATILGYYEPMDELYAISNIFITKPGGLSVTEALRWRLPILVSHLLPGQEQHNYDYLLQKGFVMPKTINIVDSALEELSTASFKQSLVNNKELDGLSNGGPVIVGAVNQCLKRHV